MNREKVIEIVKGELSRVHCGIKVVHSRDVKHNIDLFTLINEKIYLSIPVFDMDEKIDAFDDPIPAIMVDLILRLMKFMEKISK